jgi:hypothetical protein
MPKPTLLCHELSPKELREIATALADQVQSLVHIDAAVYSAPIATARSALAKVLVRIGQRAGDRCFLCRTTLLPGPTARRPRCPNGCSPRAYLAALEKRDAEAA